MELQRKIQTLDSSAMAAAPEIDPDLPEELRAAMAAERGQSAAPHRPANSFISGAPMRTSVFCAQSKLRLQVMIALMEKGSLIHGFCQLSAVPLLADMHMQVSSGVRFASLQAEPEEAPGRPSRRARTRAAMPSCCWGRTTAACT